ncbi:MAG: META domain-containing protein [Bacteroidales bacterium]|mgnify:CR=1 FL=1|jgi:hypothetical protein|nr:META domain-containing protein [Bacteroidales bacterium]
MKTQEKFFKKQMTALLLIIFPLITGISSCQKDKTLELDITKSKWELKSVIVNSNKHKKPNGNFHHPEAYILIFENDTTFWLHLSSNSSGGKYRIPTKGSITIETYSNLTEMGMTEFDELVLDVFIKMTSYTVEGNTLICKGSNSEVEFKKK